MDIAPTISKLFSYKPIPNYIGLEGGIKIKHKDVFVGVEVEVEYENEFLPLYKNSSYFSHSDGSLKIGGTEIVTIPIKLRYLEVELSRIFSQIRGKIILSNRCSTHIHMNVRDMTVEQLGNLVLLYMIFEKSLYHISGDRWDNNFCVPLYMCHKLVRQWFKDEEYTGAWTWNKYTGLNISPVFGGESSRIGTVEFRQLHGTIDTAEIINWCNLITALKRAAQNFERKEILAHIRTMKTTSGYWWLAKEVFGNWAELLTKQTSFKDDTEDCLSNLVIILHQYLK